MTAFPPAPLMPPDSAPGTPFQPHTRRERLHAALQNSRLLTVALLLVLALIMARTLVFSRETEDGRALSEMYQNSLEALSAAKSAYSPELIPVPSASTLASITVRQPVSHRAASVGASSQTPKKSHKDFAASSPIHAELLAQSRLDGLNAVAKWRTLTQSRLARPAEWRRLAIVLALFQHPGALDAIAHIDDTPPRSSRPARPPRVSLRAALQKGTRDADPFGHGPVAVSSAQEHAFWNALYGPQTLKPAQVPALRETLLRLRLGWFENVALAQLYQKAGMQAEAAWAAQAADVSPRQVRAQNALQINLFLLGIAGLLGWGMLAIGHLVKRAVRSQSRAAYRAPANPNFDFLVLPAYGSSGGANAGVPSTAPPVPPARYMPSHASASSMPQPAEPNASGQAPASALFPVSALLLAFLTYLIGHNLLGITLSFALKPFVSHLGEWSASSLLRLETALEIGLYFPIFLIPLLVLRARIAFNSVSERSASEPKMTLRTVLARLGYHTRSIWAEIGAGGLGYMLTLPAYLLISLVSHALFHRFHTPVNPAQFDTLSAHVPLDKMLVFLTAAVAAPIVEETMFRGLLYSALRARFGIAVGACLSAAVFAAVHPTLPGGFLPIWCLGVALALVYERRGSLLPGIVLHGIHNGLIMMMGFAIFS